MSPSLPALGQGDEYELPADIDLIVADEKTIRWRKQEFMRMGFSMSEAERMAVRRAADLHEVESWLDAGCSHVLALAILAPLAITPPPADHDGTVDASEVNPFGVSLPPTEDDGA